jgi:hypothetical protein
MTLMLVVVDTNLRKLLVLTLFKKHLVTTHHQASSASKAVSHTSAHSSTTQ